MDKLFSAVNNFWGNSLKKISSERIKEHALSPANEKILLDVGLPLNNSLISFYDENLMKACDLGRSRYFMIGDDYGTHIGISLNADTKNEIYSFDMKGDLPERFINSDISKLLQFLMLYENFKASLIGITDEEAKSAISEIKDEFYKIDPKSLSSEDNWWRVILEQHESGIM